jgi:hypothetical protein
MRKIIFLLLILGPLKTYTQITDDFDWTKTKESFWIDRDDQISNGPCYSIALVNMCEVLAQVQYKAIINLSVQHLYSNCPYRWCNNDPECLANAAYNKCFYAKIEGIVNEENLPDNYPLPNYDETDPTTVADCERTLNSEDYKYHIGGFDGNYFNPVNLIINSNIQMKQSILKYGPHLVYYNNHALLFYGWIGDQWRVINTLKDALGLPLGSNLYTFDFSNHYPEILRLRGISWFEGPYAPNYILRQPDADGDGYCDFAYGDLPSNCTACIGHDADPTNSNIGGFTDYGNSIKVYYVSDINLYQEISDPSDYRFTTRVRLTTGFHVKAKQECSIFRISRNRPYKSAEDNDIPVRKPQKYEILSSIYPNPANENVLIKLNTKPEKPIIAEIIDILGKVYVRSQISDEINNIDLSAIPKGTYVVRIINQDSVTSHKLIKN